MSPLLLKNTGEWFNEIENELLWMEIKLKSKEVISGDLWNVCELRILVSIVKVSPLIVCNYVQVMFGSLLTWTNLVTFEHFWLSETNFHHKCTRRFWSHGFYEGCGCADFDYTFLYKAKKIMAFSNVQLERVERRSSKDGLKLQGCLLRAQ